MNQGFTPRRVSRPARHEASGAGRADRKALPRATHSAFATHLLEDGYDIRTIQELMGQADVKTTMIYTHVLKRAGGRGILSPLDAIAGSPNGTNRNEEPQ